MNTLFRLIIVGLLTFSSAGTSISPARPLYSGLSPQAVGDAYTTAEDTPLVVPVTGTPYNGVLFNDTDPENDPLTAVRVDNVQHGTLALSTSGSFTYTPAANWNGTDTFTYQADDGTGRSNTATVTITVTAVNDIPVAAADSYTTAEDTSLTVPAPGVLSNDTQVDTGETLTAVLDGYSGAGQLSLYSDGSFSYTPALNFNGTDSFTYHAYDGTQSSNTVTVTLNVTAVDDPPAAAADQYSINEDTTMVITAGLGVLSNDSDAENDPMTAAADSLPNHGQLDLQTSGAFTYTPDPNWNGTDGFTYHAVAGGVNSNTVAVQLTVNPVNDLPQALDDTYSATEDVPLTVPAPGVLENDSDVENSPLTALIVTQPQHGSVAMNANGSFTYSPEENVNGAVTFTYSARDGTDNSAPATVTINITAVNDAPIAANNSYSTDEDTPLSIAAPGVLANDSDVEGQTLTAHLIASPGHGTLTLNPDGSFTYSPDANWHGDDSFTYQANDGSLDSNTATVTITVRSVNDPPIALDDNYSATEDVPLTIPAPGVLSNDTDIEGDLLHAVIASQPDHGSVVLNPDGSFTYTPETNYNGAVSFTYRASDGTDNSALATVTLTLAAVNDLPVPVNDTYTIAEDNALTVASLGVIANDQDVDNPRTALNAYVFQTPAHGTLTLNTDGSFDYQPVANYNGSDTFTYYLRDLSDRSAGEATVTINITPVNDAPSAVNDTFGATEDTQLSITLPASGILSNDSDVDGDPLTAVRISGPSHGTLSLNSNGTFLYTPEANYNGTDTFTYRASDGTLQSPLPAATVTINIAAVNDAPVANAQAPTTPEDTAINITLTATDVDGDLLTYTIFTPPAHGTLTGSIPNLVYTPAQDYFGADSFVFQVSDGHLTASATVQFTISAVNDAPVGAADSYTIAEDTVLNISTPGILGNDHDVDSTALTVSPYIGPSHGSLTLHTNGSFIYTPVLNYNGLDSFSYRVSDGAALSTPPTVVTITITAVNDAPIASGETYTVSEDVPLVIGTPGLLLNDSDVDGDTLTVTVTDLPVHGKVTSIGNGSFTYTPDPDFPNRDASGTDSFSYTVTDGIVTTSPVVVSLTIYQVNDAPRTIPDDYRIGREGVLIISAPSVMVNDVDVEENPIHIKSYTQPSKGTLTLDTDGNLNYVTNPGSIGSVTFTYIATDGIADSPATTVTINLQPQSSAKTEWVSPVADLHSIWVANETVPLEAVLTIPDGFPCETDDINPCSPDLTYEIDRIYMRYYYYDSTGAAHEIDLIQGPSFRKLFSTGVLKKGSGHEIDAAATIVIIAKDSHGNPVDEFHVTSEKKVIFLRRLPMDLNNHYYIPFVGKFTELAPKADLNFISTPNS